MAVSVFMPKQGQSVETCIITKWYKKKGEKVSVGDLLFAYETDKAAFEEEAKSDGILLDIFYEEGEEVPVLTDVAIIGLKDEEVKDFKRSNVLSTSSGTTPEEGAAKMQRSSAHTLQKNPEDVLRISPRAKKMAEKNQISSTELIGTGPNGRIIARDIEEEIRRTSEHTIKTKSTKRVIGENETQTMAIHPLADFPDSSMKAVSNIRKIIAKNMHASLQNSAQLTHHLSADARPILRLRNAVKERQLTENFPNITLNDMVCYALIRSLLKQPELNAHFLTDSIRTFNKVHLGMAVDTARGLMVPVLKNAEDYSLRGLSGQLKQLAESCRNGNIDPELLKAEAGSFTVSNLGAYGIEHFTPVINLPQIGILGVNTIIYRPADTGDGTIAFIPVIGLSLTYDHRAIDGAPASNFLKELKIAIENFDASID